MSNLLQRDRMALCNLIDRRTAPHRWARLMAIVEPTWHDNTVPGADAALKTDSAVDYDCRRELSLAEAVAWAQSFADPVTLYLYDADETV